MSNINDSPLLKIFEIEKNGVCSSELKNTENINLLWKYLNDEKENQKSKAKILKELTEKIKINRYICEYFSTAEDIEKKDIYIFLFELYLKKDTIFELKDSILHLLKELIINIEITKDICEFIFQKISSLYKEEEKPTPERLKEYLTLLNTIVGDTMNCQKPFNYFSCLGEGEFEMILSKKKIEVGKCLTMIINFKVSNSDLSQEDNGEEKVVSLMSINFSNGISFSFDLKYPMFLIAKEIHSKFIKTLPIEE